MPTFIEIANIVVPKLIIEKKFSGGIIEFKEYFGFGHGKRHQEDDELFSIAYMNLVDDDLVFLHSKGLDFDKNKSNDFVVVFRYGGLAWEVDWLETNGTFVWHKECKKEQKQLALQIGDMEMDEIAKAYESGEDPWQTIASQ